MKIRVSYSSATSSPLLLRFWGWSWLPIVFRIKIAGLSDFWCRVRWFELVYADVDLLALDVDSEELRMFFDDRVGAYVW